MDKTSMLYWYPRLERLDIPMPKTWVVEIKGWEYYGYLDGKKPFPKIKEVEGLIKTLPFPLFMRSDYHSAKHSWRDTCYLAVPERFGQQLYNLVEMHALEDIMGMPFNAVVFREFLPLRYSFKAFKGMPVAREFRFFCDKGKVLCYHPYWPPASIRNPDVMDWAARLEVLSAITEDEVKLLSAHIDQLKDALPEHWSVDFAQHQNGSWYLTDMALAERSYHWPGCENGGVL